MVFYLLSLAICLSCEDDLGYLYSPGKYFLILIVLGHWIFILVVEYFCSSSYWLLRCVAIKTRHTNTSSCNRGAGGDTPQLALRETDSKRDTQDNEPVLFEPDAPAPREGPRRRWPTMIG